MDDAISRKGTSAWLENMGYSYPAKVIMDEKRFPSVLGTNLAEVGTDCSEFPNNSDTISREAVADAINGIECTRHTTWYEFYQKVMTAVEKLPHAEPRRGKWHYSDGKPARIGMSFGVICDQCGTESEYCTNFCGECGADMREVTE